MGMVGQRTGSVRFEGQELIGLPSEQIARPASRSARRSAASSPASTSRKTCCCRRWSGRAGCRSSASSSCSPISRSGSAQPGHQAVGRRAADAGDRPHPAHRRAAAAARRADRGARARHHPADRQDHPRAEGARASPSCWSSRISGSPRPSRTATTSWSTAGSSTVRRTPTSTPISRSCTTILEFDRSAARTKRRTASMRTNTAGWRRSPSCWPAAAARCPADQRQDRRAQRHVEPLFRPRRRRARSPRPRWRSTISAKANPNVKVELICGDHQNKPDIGSQHRQPVVSTSTRST